MTWVIAIQSFAPGSEERRAKSSAPFIEEINVAFEQSHASHAVVSLTLLIAYVSSYWNSIIGSEKSDLVTGKIDQGMLQEAHGQWLFLADL